MNYRNTRLAKGFLSLDTIAAGRDMSKFRPLSDRGAGVERIVRMIDCSDCSIAGKPRWRVEGREAAKERTRRIDAARQKLRRMGLGYLVPTLMLICKNGRWRDESIREIAARRHLSCHAAEVRYFGHREKILKAFDVQ